MKLWAAIAAIGLAPCSYAGPGGGRPGGAGMGDASHANTGMQGMQANSSHGEDLGRSPTQLLSQNTKLAANLEKLLPTGTTAQEACGGFKSLGGCVSAVHVAHNLGIPFADLKPKVTGSAALSLGKAIHALRPDADAKAEARKAEGQAREDLRV
jgi:hypothetical protein